MPPEAAICPYTPPSGLTGPEPRKSVVVVGAGPIGLALAVELANHGVASVLVDDGASVSTGSRAICWSKRSLEIFARLGIGAKVLDKGVTWKVGRTYHHDREVFAFDLLPETGHAMPAFVNLQQYHVEAYLIERAQASALIDLRFRNRVSALAQGSDGAELEIATPDGAYTLAADYVVACDGARSPLRSMMGLTLDGEPFEERFLIADIEMTADFPSERRFWFEPTFHPGQSALLHKQPDDIYRIDLQLDADAEPEVERRPDRVIPRVERVVGHADFRLDWVSVYRFDCRRLARLCHGRVIFAGDSAHVVSPFGARGGNGGIQDVDALGWRLAAVLRGDGDVRLLDAYDRERCAAADENLRHSSRTTRFMTPAPGIEREFRDAVLALAPHAAFARGWVNSGRLSTPCVYPSAGADDARLPAGSRPGAVAPDAPLGNGWLLSELGGGTRVLAIGADAPETDLPVVTAPASGDMKTRYLGEAEEAVYLIRPDQVVAARWIAPGPGEIEVGLQAVAAGRA